MMTPELIYGTYDKKLRFSGYVVIDSLVDNESSGGLRMSNTVTFDEVKALARNMTLKYSFLGIPRGGAKSGIKVDSSSSTAKRKLILAEFGKRLSRLIRSGLYTPGTDIGTTYEDIALLLQEATGQTRLDGKIMGGNSEKYTAWTMLSSVRQALDIVNQESALSDMGASNCVDGISVAVEGFGKIGSSATKVFADAGFRVVAVSTCEGAIHDPCGLDVDQLLEMKSRFGDSFVNKYPETQRLPRDHLSGLPVRILLPCAGSWTINATNAPRIRAKIICPGANIPFTEQAEQYLFQKGVICLPDFVSNSGVVLCAYIGDSLSDKKKRDFIEQEYGQRVRALLAVSKQRGISPKAAAVEIALRRFYQMRLRDKTLPRLLIQALRFAIPDRHLEILGKPLLPYVRKQRMKLADLQP